MGLFTVFRVTRTIIRLRKLIAAAVIAENAYKKYSKHSTNRHKKNSPSKDQIITEAQKAFSRFATQVTTYRNDMKKHYSK